ncbi:hypothetical protein J6590_069403 [Homalodisca vitripennis]|nr:hypothetical protein J6590_069403 [Homalodisca vitripennis]
MSAGESGNIWVTILNALDDESVFHIRLTSRLVTLDGGMDDRFVNGIGIAFAKAFSASLG